MADRRINHPSLDQTTFTEAFTNDGLLLTDWVGLEPEAKVIPLALLGNGYIQGSSDGIIYSDVVDTNSTHLRISTDGGVTWRVLPLSDLSDIQSNLHPPLTLNIANGLSLDVTNQILSLLLATSTTAGAMPATDKDKVDHITIDGAGTKFLNDAGDYVTISTDGEINTASNLGTGNGLFAQKSGVDLQFKSLTSIDGSVVFTTSGTEIDLQATGVGGGESNTAANVGVEGIGVFDIKNGIQLEFRNINTTNNLLTVALDSLNKEVDLTVVESNIDHDALTNFVPNEHIDHSLVSVIAGIGLSGGGTIDSDVTVNMDINELTVNPTPEGTDLLAIYDPDSGNHYKVAAQDLPVATVWGDVNGDINNQGDLISILNQKVDETVGVYSGEGLTGGGLLSTDRTLSLNINGLSSTAVSLSDYFAYYDVSNLIHAKTTLQSILDTIEPELRWNLSVNSDPALEISSGDTVDFTGTGGITISRVGSDIAIDGAALNPTVLTQYSVTGDGTLGTEIQLVNDESSPGSDYYYGTLASVKGYHPMPSEAVQDLNSTAYAFDLDLGRGATVTLTSDQVVTFSNLQDNDTGHIKVTQGGSGGYRITLAGATVNIAENSQFSGDIVELTATIGAKDIIIYWYDGGILNAAVVYNML